MSGYPSGIDHSYFERGSNDRTICSSCGDMRCEYCDHCLTCNWHHPACADFLEEDAEESAFTAAVAKMNSEPFSQENQNRVAQLRMRVEASK